MASQASSKPSPIPRHTIDLSLPPKERYRRLAGQYSTKLHALTGSFDALLLDLGLSRRMLPAFHGACRLLLRRVYDRDETEELRGIAEQTGIQMYLLVALNVFLDLLMGCTSGGVRSLERGQPQNESKMLHFRMLDWGMDGLRSIVVHLDFIKSKSDNPREIVASNITYVGFVGVLTGCAPGRSISVNFRALHDGSTWLKHFMFYCHLLLVLFAWQPSIGSILRAYIFCDVIGELATTVDDFCARRTTAVYVIFSDAQRSVIVEKDLAKAEIRESNTFIAVTNHDVATKSSVSASKPLRSLPTTAEPPTDATGMAGITSESEERLDCIEQKWLSRTRRASAKSPQFVTQRVLRNWLRDWPTMNECTHFAAVMDPEAGKVIWSEVYLVPQEDPNLYITE